MNKSEVRKILDKKMGRPTSNPKSEEIKVRISKEDKEKLEYCISNSDKNGVRIDIWTHFMRECIINYVH